ncbi:MAG TPA: IS21 family transposase [Candidatus Acidoferrum sp.]|nr:IS21 family transposase [Candidatus Acidoferrum sp.]
MSNTEKTQEVAASKAGMDVKTARKYLRARRLPSEMKAERHWRTRKDWFEDVWPRIREQLSTNPGLEVKTIFAALQREHPERFADGQLRTLQRKVKHWRATEGPAQEIYFVQEHRAGELCESDFTHLTELGVSIAGEEFPHLLYHFVLTYSNWETGMVCYSESFASLSEGLQQALWELGGVPVLHRTDRMTAAINNLTDLADFQRNYQALMRHYGMEGRKIQTGRPNENGDVEQGHYRFKRALEQALLLRGSRDFPSVREYELFLKRLFEQLNSGRKERFVQEMEVLRALPERRFDSAKRVRVRVSSGSLINVERNSYSVNSRLIGEIVEARVFANHLEVWYGGQKLEQLPRLRGRTNYRVDYRHIIDWLVRKPGAFANYRYREHLFPTCQFRKVYDLLREVTPRRCDRRYLEILQLAAKEGEVLIDDALRLLLQSAAGRQAIINKEAFEEFLDRCGQAPDITDVHIAEVSLASFDQLFSETEVVQ